MANWTYNDIPDQTGKIAIVTGANSGLGYWTTLGLAGKKARVIMACRNIEKGETARAEIMKQMPNAQLEVMALDLSSLDSVRSFAEAVNSQLPQLNILVNNAGVMAIPRRLTPDGFEMQFGVNHLGHFALTGLLLDLLVKTPGSRVVSVSSVAGYQGAMNFDDLHGERNYTRYGAYSQSKLSNILFAFELNRRLQQAGVDVISNVAHPGYSDTNLQSTSTTHSGSPVEKVLYGILNPLVAQSAEMGALPQLYAATAPDAEGGAYYGPRWMSRGYPTKARVPAKATKADDARRLWEASEQMTGVTYDLGTSVRAG